MDEREFYGETTLGRAIHLLLSLKRDNPMTAEEDERELYKKYHKYQKTDSATDITVERQNRGDGAVDDENKTTTQISRDKEERVEEDKLGVIAERSTTLSEDSAVQRVTAMRIDKELPGKEEVFCDQQSMHDVEDKRETIDENKNGDVSHDVAECVKRKKESNSESASCLECLRWLRKKIEPFRIFTVSFACFSNCVFFFP
jgi:hypothetical protein